MNFWVTNSAACAPAPQGCSVKRPNVSIEVGRHTELHDSLQICRSELDHDGVSITINDFRVVRVSVGNAVLCLDLLLPTSVRDPHNDQTSQTCLVFSIICRPNDVVLDEIARQGSLPIVAPVKPYTELALICGIKIGSVANISARRDEVYLQSKLPTIKHSPLEGVRLLLEVSLGALTRRDEVLKNSRKQALPLLRRGEEVCQ